MQMVVVLFLLISAGKGTVLSEFEVCALELLSESATSRPQDAEFHLPTHFPLSSEQINNLCRLYQSLYHQDSIEERIVFLLLASHYHLLLAEEFSEGRNRLRLNSDQLLSVGTFAISDVLTHWDEGKKESFAAQLLIQLRRYFLALQALPFLGDRLLPDVLVSIISMERKLDLGSSPRTLPTPEEVARKFGFTNESKK